MGYGVGDENLHDILNRIEKNLGDSSLKHFALVHEVDEMADAEWEGIVEFVAGDATEFFDLIAKEHRALGPTPFNPVLARTNFERQLNSGNLSNAGETCEELAKHLEAQGERAGAGSLWRSFGEAAREAGEHGSAAAALKRVGELFHEAGYDLDAEPVLSAALGEAETAGASALQQEILPLLQKVRLSTGRYDDVLKDTEQALGAYALCDLKASV
jgi:tetratricopeptide (TPR) repeat protein